MKGLLSGNLTKILIILLSSVTIIAVGISIWAVVFRDTNVLAPDYLPVDKELHAEAIPGDSNDKLFAPEGGGSVSISCSDKVSINLNDRQASLMFANPGKSNQDMVVQLVIQDKVIIQSGALSPGYQVKKLNLLPGVEKKLIPGGYNGKFVIFYYHP
ncbi:MAG: hypothetical protein II270_07275, partial [Peptococcaceae bacterium]|nr:hypothetical protein [Peptococcaceae bacterium]